MTAVTILYYKIDTNSINNNNNRVCLEKPHESFPTVQNLVDPNFDYELNS